MSQELIVYQSFEQFYPFYLKEHSNRTNKRLHFVGTSLAVLALILITLTGNYRYLYVPFLIGYGFAWVGHFFFQKNKPATFKYPLFSLRGDFKLWSQILSGKIKF
ncbi:hypothetical protein SAMD00019534_045910 [Acytostelium subglobosum LB1]|uniref:hypothetical protein n=1 Tax=Acytostelium subglobosum LB1 TaxID=1410327 RepID=UPI0006450193|nr:hypothetical protein SAMD00019534_045910 [Acytostelium subglobosum LB1]GAM21416.1 hypothetical protein SAMD00019534_045910 [Acytostelium subglobosum LB1]|eukprot:XP_012755535.1 hypothetical protein SAMD00019534_045910 [Acytostelium subglobosum LB1]